jgi:DNA (cytosine-5)-methyltransferase 1
MKVLDLFSGIGGFSLGLEWAGMETIAMCEKDKFCRQVLAKHWPDITIHEDIRKLDGREYKNAIDVVCGGFPCQPFSVAGKQLGKEDDRHLWPEMLRVIKESAPTWVIGENVSGFVSMALDDVCLDLEAEGYEVQSFVIPACAVEAHHKRDRCWIVAYSDENERRRRDSALSQERHTRMEHRSGGQGQPIEKSTEGMAHANELRLEEHGHREPENARQGSKSLADTHPSRELQSQGSEQEVRRRIGDSREDVADTESERIQRLWSSREQKPYAYGPALVPLCEGEGLGSTYWEAEPDVDRVVDGVPNRVDRIKSLGNAVVPQLVQRIGELVYAEHHRSARD